MPTYITLYRLTQKGAESIKGIPARTEANLKAVEDMGIKVKDWYLTMGQYDIVVIAEAPDDRTAAKALLAIGMQGNVGSETLRAFSQEEAFQIIAELQ